MWIHSKSMFNRSGHWPLVAWSPICRPSGQSASKFEFISRIPSIKIVIFLERPTLYKRIYSVRYRLSCAFYHAAHIVPSGQCVWYPFSVRIRFFNSFLSSSSSSLSVVRCCNCCIMFTVFSLYFFYFSVSFNVFTFFQYIGHIRCLYIVTVVQYAFCYVYFTV